jgi:lipopolysaccharide biosynthesis glycosyltransferase
MTPIFLKLHKAILFVEKVSSFALRNFRFLSKTPQTYCEHHLPIVFPSMKTAPIHLITGGDLLFLPGIRATVASALIGISENRAAVFHILDGGLGEDVQRSLQSMAQRCHANANLIFHTIPDASIKRYMPGPGNSRMYYARIGMASLMTNVERGIYLDSDTLVMGDLSDLWDSDFAGAIVMASRDRKVCLLYEDSPWPLAPREESLPYFNSGIMLVDFQKWRAENVEQQCLDLIANPSVTYQWWDQTILNHVLRGKVGFLPQEWNWQSEEFPPIDEPTPRILHYTTRLKPWFYWGSAIRFQAWRILYKACVGSPCLLFLRNGSWRGLGNGFFDGILDSSRLIRSFYLIHLKLTLKLSRNQERSALLEQKIHFLTSPRKSHNRFREKQLVKEYRQRLTPRLGRRHA